MGSIQLTVNLRATLEGYKITIKKVERASQWPLQLVDMANTPGVERTFTIVHEENYGPYGFTDAKVAEWKLSPADLRQSITTDQAGQCFRAAVEEAMNEAGRTRGLNCFNWNLGVIKLALHHSWTPQELAMPEQERQPLREDVVSYSPALLLKVDEGTNTDMFNDKIFPLVKDTLKQR